MVLFVPFRVIWWIALTKVKENEIQTGTLSGSRLLDTR
jgi:hypothetical protein